MTLQEIYHLLVANAFRSRSQHWEGMVAGGFRKPESVCYIPLRNRDSWCPRDKHPIPEGLGGPIHSVAVNKHLGEEKNTGAPSSPVEAWCPECGQQGPFYPESPRLFRRQSEMLKVMFRERHTSPEENETAGFIAGSTTERAQLASGGQPLACAGTWWGESPGAVTAGWLAAVSSITACVPPGNRTAPGPSCLPSGDSWATGSLGVCLVKFIFVWCVLFFCLSCVFLPWRGKPGSMFGVLSFVYLLSSPAGH